MSRLLRLSRPALASVAIVALTIGLPTGLVRAVGWPLPTRWPAADELWQRLGDAYIADSTIFKVLAVVVWMTWVQLVVALAVETVGRARGRVPVRIPFMRPTQSLANWLVGSLLVASSLAGVRGVATAAPLASVIAHVDAAELETAPSDGPQRPAAPAPLADAASASYVVVPGDNLWDIAEACLGPGRATEEPGSGGYNARVARLVAQVFELNEGKEQPDGRWLRKPSLIRPGWILDLPDGARVQVVSKTPVTPVAETPPIGDVDDTVEKVGAPTPAPASTLPVVVRSTLPPAADIHPAPLVPSEARPPTKALAGVLGVAAAGVGVGLARALRVRRRQVLSKAQPGSVAPPSDPEFEDLRSSIAQSDDRDVMACLAGALWDLSAQLVRIKSRARPRLVQCRQRGVEVLLTASALPAPSGWRPEASGAVWTCPHASDGMRAGSPTPALVTLGRADNGASLHLDLETEGCVSVVGDPDAVLALGRSVTVELAHSTLAETMAVVLVGDLGEDAVGLDRTSSAAGWSEVLDAATAWASQSSDALAANRWSSALHARACGAEHDALSPLVVVATAAPDREQLMALEMLPLPSTLTIVALGWELPVSTRIEVEIGELRVPALGISCVPQGLESDTVHAVGGLLDQSAAPLMPMAPEPPPPFADDVDLRDPYVDPPHDIVVRVLGDIEVVGGRRRLSPLQTAAVAYIALHTPVAASRVEDAIWTLPTANRHKRLANTVSEARAALGAHHFPVAADGRYSVGPAVMTDARLFEHRVAYAATQRGPAAIETLQGALELVRGPLFSYRSADRSSFVWVDLENWAVTAELMVIEAALRCGDLCLECGDADGAVSAARAGLSASPAHSGLTELLMRAHAAAGDRRAAALVFENHVNALQALELDDVDESTLRLRDVLVGETTPRTAP